MKSSACDLESCFLCRNCISEWKELIGLKKKTFFFKKGEAIFSEGTPVRGMFFINEGFAKIAKNWGAQKELILRFARPGDVLGLRGFGGEHGYPVSAVAIEDTKVCFIDNDFLDTVQHTNLSFTIQLMNVYAAELQKAERRMRDLVHMDVKSRIAVALLELEEVFGANSEGFISVPVSRQDIASFSGTTYETIFKFFNELLEKQILITAGKSIKISDRDRLSGFISKHVPAKEPQNNLSYNHA